MSQSDEPPSDGASAALPLAEAAARLGLSRDALRMRIRRGTARGFKRGGQVFVWLDQADAPEAPAAPPARAADARPAKRAWPALVARQRREIARLIRETDRLNARLERHLEEAREMRQMLQREQVLRQQELALHRDVQALLRRLVAQPGLEPGLAGVPALGVPEAPDPDPAPAAPLAGPGGASQDLAEMLKDIGQSLREAAAKEPPERG